MKSIAIFALFTSCLAFDDGFKLLTSFSQKGSDKGTAPVTADCTDVALEFDAPAAEIQKWTPDFVPPVDICVLIEAGSIKQCGKKAKTITAAMTLSVSGASDKPIEVQASVDMGAAADENKMFCHTFLPCDIFANPADVKDITKAKVTAKITLSGAASDAKTPKATAIIRSTGIVGQGEFKDVTVKGNVWHPVGVVRIGTHCDDDFTCNTTASNSLLKAQEYKATLPTGGKVFQCDKTKDGDATKDGEKIHITVFTSGDTTCDSDAGAGNCATTITASTESKSDTSPTSDPSGGNGSTNGSSDTTSDAKGLVAVGSAIAAVSYLLTF